MRRRWTEEDIAYLDGHASDGAEAVALHLGRSVQAIKVMASRRGVSLARSWLCPNCGCRTFFPLVGKTGWCKACTVELGAKKASRVNYELRRQVAAERERIADAERRRQALYKDNEKQRKKICRFREGGK